MKYRSVTSWLSALSMALLAESAACANNGSVAGHNSRGTAETSAAPAHLSASDEVLQTTVEDALQSDPYFYAAHVNVSVEGGNVLLRGFVFSDWDLRDAIRIATKAAGGRRVIDDLSIEVAGRR